VFVPAPVVQAPEEDRRLIDASGLTVMQQVQEEGDAAVMMGGVTAFSREKSRVHGAGAGGGCAAALLSFCFALTLLGVCGMGWLSAYLCECKLPLLALCTDCTTLPTIPGIPLLCPSERRELEELEAAMAELEEDEEYGDAEGAGDLLDDFVLAATEQGPEAAAAAANAQQGQGEQQAEEDYSEVESYEVDEDEEEGSSFAGSGGEPGARRGCACACACTCCAHGKLVPCPPKEAGSLPGCAAAVWRSHLAGLQCLLS
jgi:hypothetical protein